MQRVLDVELGGGREAQRVPDEADEVAARTRVGGGEEYEAERAKALLQVGNEALERRGCGVERARRLQRGQGVAVGRGRRQVQRHAQRLGASTPLLKGQQGRGRQQRGLQPEAHVKVLGGRHEEGRKGRGRGERERES